jgi:hypothetical protein
MPLGAAEDYGTEKGGGKSEDYCVYCYKDGAFLAEMTMDEMINFCAENVQQWSPGTSKEEAIAQMNEFFPTLKRWQ